jgi:hypothetical protein
MLLRLLRAYEEIVPRQHVKIRLQILFEVFDGFNIVPHRRYLIPIASKIAISHDELSIVLQYFADLVKLLTLEFAYIFKETGSHNDVEASFCELDFVLNNIQLLQVRCRLT